MATKTWVGGDTGGAGDLSIANNWLPLSIRNAVVKWTASGSGTSEYYMELTAGGDPSAEEPGDVQENGTDMTEGTAGSLAAGEWDYGDNDTLGYSTVYVRLADSADPDSKVLDYLTYTAIPIASDDLVIPASNSNAINAGLQSLAAISLGGVYVGATTAAIATSTEYVRLTCTSFRFEATGAAYIDLQASAISPIILSTATASTGTVGLYLLGSALVTLHISGGSVGLAWRDGETSTCATVLVAGSGAVWIGAGAVVTTVELSRGSCICRESLTTLTLEGGTAELQDAAAVTTANVLAGTLTYNSSGTITTANVSGALNTTGSTQTRTISTLKLNPGASFAWDKSTVTVTAFAAPDEDVTYSAS